MLGHLGINVPDLSTAPLVGFRADADDEFAYQPADSKPGTYLF